MLRKYLKQLKRDESGNALLIMAGALVPILIAVGIGVDVGRTYTAKSRLQSACDAGVLAARQIMEGTSWNETRDGGEGRRFFDFNFPANSFGATNLVRNFQQNSTDQAEVLGSASAVIPTMIMSIFGFDSMDIAVSCDAKRELGHNDIMLVLDVTGSMLCQPGSGTCSSPAKSPNRRIDHLRKGANTLYTTIGNQTGAITRYGFVPYSQAVNVGGVLADKDMRATQIAGGYKSRDVTTCSKGKCTTTVAYDPWVGEVDPYKNVTLSNGSTASLGWTSRSTFRASNNACVEERNSVGFDSVKNQVVLADIDNFATAGVTSDEKLRFGVYSPALQAASVGAVSSTSLLASFTKDSSSYNYACPAKATMPQAYTSSAFSTALNSATGVTVGYTYHDIGMLWGVRMMSREGFRASDHQSEILGVPVSQHIIFMTDGTVNTSSSAYTAYGIEDELSSRNKLVTTTYNESTHMARLLGACELAKAKGMTVWVVVVDASANAFRPCATSPGHFQSGTSSDLEAMFKKIGQGIANLRLTR